MCGRQFVQIEELTKKNTTNIRNFCIIFPVYMLKLIVYWEHERGRDNHENRKI